MPKLPDLNFARHDELLPTQPVRGGLPLRVGPLEPLGRDPAGGPPGLEEVHVVVVGRVPVAVEDGITGHGLGLDKVGELEFDLPEKIVLAEEVVVPNLEAERRRHLKR